MRRIVFSLAVFMAVAAPVAAQTPLKIGYINSQAILAQTPGAQEAANQFDSEMQALRAQLQPASDSLDAMIKQYQSQSLAMSPEAKARRETEIQQRQQDLQQRAQQLENQAQQRRSEIVQPIMDKISTVIEQIRAEGHYHLIFDVAAGSLVAADSTLDLTDEVVRRLQAANAAGGGN
jgi:outer membrane protein